MDSQVSSYLSRPDVMNIKSLPNTHTYNASQSVKENFHFKDALFTPKKSKSWFKVLWFDLAFSLSYLCTNKYETIIKKN